MTTAPPLSAISIIISFRSANYSSGFIVGTPPPPPPPPPPPTLPPPLTWVGGGGGGGGGRGGCTFQKLSHLGGSKIFARKGE